MEISTTDLTVTPAAASKVAELMREEDLPELALRIYITGGGCSGFQYGFTFDESVDENDMTLTQWVQDQSVKVVIDDMSFPYLKGATIDFMSGVDGEYFKISNPQAKSTCGCGSSFELPDSA